MPSRRPTLALLALVLLIGPGCAVFVPRQANTKCLEGESVRLKVTTSTTPGVAPGDGLVDAGPGAVTLAFDLGKNLLSNAIEREKTYYQHTYTGRALVNLKAVGHIDTIRLERTLAGREGEAAVVEFELEETGNATRTYLFRPKNVALREAGAKLLDARWYYPWTWFFETSDKVDLEAKVTITVLTIDATGAAKQATVLDTTFKLPPLAPGHKVEIKPCEHPNGQSWVFLPEDALVQIDVSITEKDPTRIANTLDAFKGAASAAIDKWKAEELK